MTTIRIRKARKATVEELGKAKLGKWFLAPSSLLEVHIYGELRAVVAINSNGRPVVAYVQEAYAGHRPALMATALQAHTLATATAGIWGQQAQAA